MTTSIHCHEKRARTSVAVAVCKWKEFRENAGALIIEHGEYFWVYWFFYQNLLFSLCRNHFLQLRSWLASRFGAFFETHSAWHNDIFPFHLEGSRSRLCNLYNSKFSIMCVVYWLQIKHFQLLKLFVLVNKRSLLFLFLCFEKKLRSLINNKLV